MNAVLSDTMCEDPSIGLKGDCSRTQEGRGGEIKEAANCEWRMFLDCIIPVRLN